MYISFAKTSRKRAIARWRNRWRRLIGSLTLFIFTVSLITTLGHLPPALAVDPFICDGTLYISQATFPADPTQLNVLNRSVFPFVLDTSGPPISGVRYNGMGFNVKDNFIYAIDPDPGNSPRGQTVYRIGKDGQVDNLGKPNGLPGGASFFAGDFDANGDYLIYDLNTGRLFKLNVTTTPPTVVGSPVTLTILGDYADLAFNPVDEKLYGISTQTRRLSVIDPNTGNVQTFGQPRPPGNPYGAVFFDAFGNLFAYENGQPGATNGGTLYLVNVGVNGNGTGEFQQLGNALGVQRNDGAGCAFAPKVEKTVEPPVVTAGQIVTYTYRIVNRTALDPLANLTFTDTLGDGRTFVDGSLTITPTTVTGTPNAFGGTPTLQINNLTLPNQTIAEITVQVQVPSTTPPGTILNQSQLTGIPLSFGGPSILSNFPPAGQVPSPTPLQVTDNPVKLEASKTAQVIDNSDNPTAAPGKELLYTVTIKNTGTAPSTNTVSTDDIPANTTYVPNSTTLNGNSVADG
jgi:uncharacterized repeat protein (TIGR01451 family)